MPSVYGYFPGYFFQSIDLNPFKTGHVGGHRLRQNINETGLWARFHLYRICAVLADQPSLHERCMRDKRREKV
jgi:hypothetical protein